ncbi:hypothetical protein [uncultured Vibrio sp.]|uniref:hypothetical protein n=1 Tax=uncultured Vibrio sp. TaxID=114054 RepID=UPI00261CC315|nr:hypothetical protein [uncultured Vibrio sp.]
MNAMGVPLPSDIFGAVTTTYGALLLIEEAKKRNDLSTLKKLGPITASAWAGLVIGSSIMAANRATRCSITQSDVKRASEYLGFNDLVEDSWSDIRDYFY